MRTRTLGAFAATAVLVAFAATAAVSTSPAAAAERPRVNLSTPASISAYLASKGVDLSTVVWQTGVNNYAGPKCPGLGWNCTTASNVVQIATAGGQNKFECDPAFFGSEDDPPFPVPDDVVTNPLLGICVIVQISESGQNHARCYERTTANPASLRCIVYQENGTGHNHLQIHQRVRQTGGAEQTADVDIDLVQENDAGNNFAHLVQQITQTTSDVEASLQTQDAEFDIFPADQDTETGNNVLHLVQHLHQDGTATGPTTITQQQFNDQFGDVDQFAGESELTIAQFNGEGGFSHLFASQTEHQQLRGPGTQQQFGPQGCCGASTTSGDPDQTMVNIAQRSTQSEIGGVSQTQQQNLNGSCNTNGTCTITHHANNDEASTQASVTDTGVVFLTTSCSSAQSEDETGEGGCTTTDEPPFED